MEPPTCTRPTSMGDASHVKEPTHDNKIGSYMFNSSQDLQQQKETTSLKPSISKSLAKDTMERNIMEGVDVEGIVFLAKTLDLGLKDDNDYHNDESKSRDFEDMSNHNSMLQLDVPIRTLRWKELLTCLHLFMVPHNGLLELNHPIKEQNCPHMLMEIINFQELKTMEDM